MDQANHFHERFIMNDLLKKIAIITLALGIIGIILGISVGLYRNDVLAKMQTDGQNSEEQFYPEQDQSAEGNESTEFSRENNLYDLFIWGNLHTTFLTVGTVLTTLSVILILFGNRKHIN